MLQFNPGSYLQALQYRDSQNQRPDPRTVTEPLMQGLQLMLQNKQLNQQTERQAMLDKFMQTKETREQQESEANFGRPIDPNQMYGEPTGQMGRSSMMPGGQGPVAQSGNLRQAFEKWRSGAMKGPAEPEFVGALPKDDRKIFLERENPKPISEEDLALKRARAEYLSRPPKENFNQENNLRSQFLSQSRDFIDTAASYQRMVDSSRSPSAAGDLALIFNYMKMLDPGSTVREGEFANAQNSGSVPQVIAAQYNKVISGERLNDSMRQDFMGRATDLYRGQLSRHKQREVEFQNLATQYGGNGSRVTPNLATPIGGYGGESESQRVRVSNGKETLEIDASDLAEAESEGFRRL